MKILLVDGLNTYIRNFCVVPTMDSNGEPVGGITGFLKSVKMMVRETATDLVLICWDGEGGSRKRRGIYDEYKAGRKVRLNREFEEGGADAQAHSFETQLKLTKSMCDLLGFVQVECPEVEADDVIAFVSRYVYPDDSKVIMTTDRDMLQLVDVNTVVYSPTKKVYWTTDEIKSQVGCIPENYVYIKALCGDKSDNIAGMGGIGEKTAMKLFPFLGERPSNPEEIFAHAKSNESKGAKYSSILEQRDRFLENVKLMQLSNPIFSAQSATIIRTSATQQRPKFNLTAFKIEIARRGLPIMDSDFERVITTYRSRTEKR